MYFSFQIYTFEATFQSRDSQLLLYRFFSRIAYIIKMADNVLFITNAFIPASKSIYLCFMMRGISERQYGVFSEAIAKILLQCKCHHCNWQGFKDNNPILRINVRSFSQDFQSDEAQILQLMKITSHTAPRWSCSP